MTEWLELEKKFPFIGVVVSEIWSHLHTIHKFGAHLAKLEAYIQSTCHMQEPFCDADVFLMDLTRIIVK